MIIRMDIPSTGWEIPTGYAYLAVPISAFLMLLFTLADLDHRIKREKVFLESTSNACAYGAEQKGPCSS